jgi:hypothetical protein
MSLFSFGKEKQKEGGDPTVMAYLEDAFRVKAPCMLIHKNEIPCNISVIQEPAGTMQLHLHANLMADKGTKVSFVLIIDGMRIGGHSKLQEVKPGSAVIDIPSSFELMERRKKQRAKTNPREGTTVALLSGLFDGIGISGLADNLSEGGVRVKVENAIEIKSEKRITITGRTLHSGQIFPIVKISKIPRTVATVECGGKMVYTEVTSGTTYVGVSFEELKSEFGKLIDGFVTSRASPPPNSLPPRARRHKEESPGGGGGVGLSDRPAPKDDSKSEAKEDSKKDSKDSKSESKSDSKGGSVSLPPQATPDFSAPPASDAAASPTPDSAIGAAPTAPTAAAGGGAPSTPNTPESSEPPPGMEPDGMLDGEQEPLDRPAPTPLQKIKRKGRSVVLFGTDVDALSRLGALLLADGYGRVQQIGKIEDLIDSAPPGGAGLILLDLDMPFEHCLAISNSIAAHLPDKTPLVLVSENSQIGIAATNDAQKAGVSLLLPRPLKIDNSLLNKFEELMGIM